MTNGIGRVGWRNYVSPVPTIWNNLTHYYSADNTSIDSKGTIHGTLINGATYSTGKINGGFQLDGVNDYVNAGNLFGFDGTTPFSFSFWFKLNANIDNYTIKYLVGNQTTTAFPTNGTGVFLYTGDGGATNRLVFAMANNSNMLRVAIKNNLVINTFYHCVVSYNGNGLNSGLNTYINAVSEKLSVLNDSLTLPISSSSQLSTFGSTLGTSNFFNGVIDEVGVWDRALTSTDVTELYNGGAGKQYVVPVVTLNPDFAYSFRKIISNATASCRVRRSSDNAEQNIGFVGNDLDNTALSAFVGSGNGFVVKIYDQKGSGKDLTQTYASSQFQIVNAGVIYTLNGKTTCVTALKWMATPYTLYPFGLTDANSIFSVTKPISQVGSGFNVDFLFSIGNSALGASSRLFDNGISGAAGNPTTYNANIESGTSVISTAYSSGTKLQSTLFKNNEQKYYLNNSLIGTNTNTLVPITGNVGLTINDVSWLTIGTAPANQYFSEILIYKSYQNTAISDIHTNINNYYSIY